MEQVVVVVVVVGAKCRNGSARAGRRRRRRARRLVRYIVALGWALVGRPFVWESESAQAQVGRGGISWVLGCLDGWMGGWVGGVGVSMVTKTSWMLGSLLGTKGAHEQMDCRGRAREQPKEAGPEVPYKRLSFSFLVSACFAPESKGRGPLPLHSVRGCSEQRTRTESAHLSG